MNLENKKTNIKLILLIIILLIISTILAYLTFKYFNSRKEKESNEKIEETVTNKDIELEFGDSDYLVTDQCISRFNYYSCANSLSKDIERKEFKIDVISNGVYEFYYDNKKISSLNINVNDKEEYTSIKKIYNVKDAIIVFYFVGTDIRGYSIYAFNLKTGKEYLNTKSLDNDLPGMQINEIAQGVKSVYVSDGNIYIVGSRWTHGDCLVLDKEVCGADIGKYVDENEVTSGLYKIIVGNDNAEIVNENYTRLKDVEHWWNNY